MTIDKTTMTTILVVNKTAAISRSPISHLTEFLAIRIASLTCAYSVTDYRLLEFRNFLLGKEVKDYEEHKDQTDH